MRRFGWLLVAVLMVSCSGKPVLSPPAVPTAMPQSSSALQGVFSGSDSIAGWTTTEAARIYNRDNIFDLVDGQADAFFAYGLVQVAVQRYQDTEGARLDIEVWQLATPADAYGLFTTVASGAPAAIGNEGDAEPGRRLSFWQDRYTVHVSARQQVDDAILQGFAQAISAALPKGGQRPALVSRLPQTGLKERGFIFFHEELSIQDQVWLGGKNILGLSHDTNGVVARYNLGGATARLLLIQYPSADKAAAGLAALKSSQVKDLVATDVRETLLGAVLGQVNSAAASALLTEALK